MEVAIGYHVEYVLKILIEASWRNRRHMLLEREDIAQTRAAFLDNPVPVVVGSMPNIQFLNQFCTIRMATARGSGHTTSLMSVSRLFVKPIVLFPNVAMADHVLKRSLVMNADGMYLSVRQLDQARGVDYDAILVDCSFLLSPKEMDDIKMMCLAGLPAHPERFCLVLVG